jgi:hypothetical protein
MPLPNSLRIIAKTATIIIPVSSHAQMWVKIKTRRSTRKTIPAMPPPGLPYLYL